MTGEQDTARDAGAEERSGAGPAVAPAEHQHLERGQLPMALALVVAVAAGGLTAVQSRINGEFARVVGDPYTAAAISFGSGLVILSLALCVWRPGRVGLGRVREALADRRLAWWMLLGGLAGAWFVTTQGLSAATLGVALFTVAIVAGQTVGGILFDLIGLGPGGRRRLTPTRVLGAVLALGAIAWAVSAQLAHDVPLLLLLLPFTAGVGVGWQQAVNGRVKQAAGSALTATFGNFLGGTIALVVAAVVHGAIAGFPALPGTWWLYVGGALGCLFIGAQAAVVRTIGVLLLALCGVAGQLAAALALDLLLPTAERPLEFATVGGTVLALVAVLVASIRWSRHAHAAKTGGA
ncbi:DMT family transporter [Agromyces soli]|uniref:DMT family transporter n=1 Tax=Agromyces soli TaxID=659012 RepID=A0ABY4AS77_9MICO|nr:DMT family transporter [Agromyces soli]UOE24726.1 DMT family transporter [Agromyces soli]